MKLRIKLIHLIHMATDESYRTGHERRARFARVMAANKSIMAGRETGCQQNATNTLNPLYSKHYGTNTHGPKIRTTRHYMSSGTTTTRTSTYGILSSKVPRLRHMPVSKILTPERVNAYRLIKPQMVLFRH